MKKIWLLVMFIAACGRDSWSCIRKSDGTRTGYVVQLSRTGVVFSSWEGTLHLGQSAAGASGEADWNFSVREGNDDVVRQLQVAQETGVKVSLVYQEYVNSGCGYASNYFVERVKVSQ